MRPREYAGAPDLVTTCLTTENEISCVLCLGGSVHNKLAIVAKLLQPTGHIRELILVMQ